MRQARSIIEKNGYLFAVLCITASTALFLAGRAYFAKGQWAILYLLVIGLVAGLSGVRPALVAAVLAFFTWNFFFLPPYHRFTVADPKDWLSLFAFLFTSVAVGLQTGRMRERESEALAREREMTLLNDFSAHLVSDNSISDMAGLLINEVKRVTTASCVRLFLCDEASNLYEINVPSNKRAPSVVLETAEWVARESKAIGLPVALNRSGKSWPVAVAPENAGVRTGSNEIFIPLQTASSREGVLFVAQRDDERPYSLRDAQLLIAVTNQAAAFLERKRLHAVAVQADALQEADKLKSTLVSSVSHELKTPLASMTATVSNLLEQDVVWDESNVREELEMIQDDLQRLNNSIGALLDLSRLEASAWEPKKDLYELGEILGSAISKMPLKQRSRISCNLPDDLPAINVDFSQWVQCLQNLLGNALVYSPADSPVRVGASHKPSEILMWVEDEGPGIPSEEKEKIFQKFYRGKTSVGVPSGTGLGLAVTLEIVRYHGGEIRVEDVVPHGTKVVISLPRENN